MASAKALRDGLDTRARPVTEDRVQWVGLGAGGGQEDTHQVGLSAVWIGVPGYPQTLFKGPDLVSLCDGHWSPATILGCRPLFLGFPLSDSAVRVCRQAELRQCPQFSATGNLALPLYKMTSGARGDVPAPTQPGR